MVTSEEWVWGASIGDFAYYFICLNFKSRHYLVTKIKEKRADMKKKINKIISLFCNARIVKATFITETKCITLDFHYKQLLFKVHDLTNPWHLSIH